jgi:hypothetical protein
MRICEAFRMIILAEPCTEVVRATCLGPPLIFLEARKLEGLSRSRDTQSMLEYYEIIWNSFLKHMNRFGIRAKPKIPNL